MTLQMLDIYEKARQYGMPSSPETVLPETPEDDAWTEGDEPCVEIDFGGLTGYAVPAT